MRGDHENHCALHLYRGAVCANRLARVWRQSRKYALLRAEPDRTANVARLAQAWIFDTKPPAAAKANRQIEVTPLVVNGVMYVLSTGCQWRYIPKDLPPRSTVHDYLTRWNDDGTIEKIHYALYVQCREAIGREASPTACVIDSQSVKSAEKGGPASIRPGMTRARRSKARSGISWSTR